MLTCNRRAVKVPASGVRIWIVVLVGSLTAILAAPLNAEPARLHHYTVSIDSELNIISVHACFDGRPPLYLIAASLDAAAALEQARIEGVRKPLEPNGAELKLGAQPDNACLVYRTDIGQFKSRHQRGGNPTRHVGRDLLTDLGVWFWRPDSLAPDEEIEIRFDLPAGIAVSAPWRQAQAADGSTVYWVGHSPYDWPAAVAFGHFDEQSIAVPGAVLRVAVLEGIPAVDLELVRQWLTRAATAVTTLYGSFPVANPQLLVVPGARGDEPVPWAYVLRGGAPSAHFFINQRRPASEFMTDWTAVHELSHLLLPYLRPEDAWLAEGTASYYQHVLRARSGMIASAEAWQSLHSGFRRGMKSQPDTTLADATERMYKNGAFMRVYWEGAAIMLLADQRLRSRTNGTQSLDSALRQLHECCVSSETGWQAAEVFAKLDELTGTTVFRELYEANVGSEAFPDLTETYALLGLRVRANAAMIDLDEGDATKVQLRDSIMGPPTTAQYPLRPAN